MKKEICWAIVWIIAVTLAVTSLADAADFTVDERSLLHLFGSGGLSATANTLLVEYDIPDKKRRMIAAGLIAGVGAFKEFVVDSKPDYGDLTFNLIGIGGGIFVSEKYFILPSEKGVTVGGKF